MCSATNMKIWHANAQILSCTSATPKKIKSSLDAPSDDLRTFSAFIAVTEALDYTPGRLNCNGKREHDEAVDFGDAPGEHKAKRARISEDDTCAMRFQERDALRQARDGSRIPLGVVALNLVCSLTVILNLLTAWYRVSQPPHRSALPHLQRV